ncbi:MAG: pacearchaeosortase [Nanoarchaeota archaeon]
MKKTSLEILDISFRYIILLVVGLFFIKYLYTIFTPITLYPVYFILSLFFNVSINGVKIILPNTSIELINACIAGSAYYLLLMLNLSTAKIKIIKRFYLLLFLFLSFLILNIARILILIFLINTNSQFFDFTHKAFLYLFSFIFVVGIWFLGAMIFKIKSVPFISDIKLIYKSSSLKKLFVKQ